MFCFVNTDDTDGASRARAALQGYNLNGSQLRINDAIKREANLALPTEVETPDNLARMSARVKDSQAPLPTLPDGTLDASHVTDDKGNPARGNLWVGGFRETPTEIEVRGKTGGREERKTRRRPV